MPQPKFNRLVPCSPKSLWFASALEVKSRNEFLSRHRNSTILNPVIRWTSCLEIPSKDSKFTYIDLNSKYGCQWRHQHANKTLWRENWPAAYPWLTVWSQSTRSSSQCDPPSTEHDATSIHEYLFWVIAFFWAVHLGF